MAVNYEIKVFNLEQLCDKEFIEVPTFQRGGVWKRETRRAFIKTLQLGDPFGSILLSQTTSYNKYKLIDGLQRVTTIRHFYEKPELYISDDLISDDFTKEIELLDIEYMPKERLKNIRQDIVEEYKKHKDDKAMCSNITQEIASRHGFKGDKKFKLFSLIERITNEISEKMELQSIDVPVIIYKGPEENLPDVFEKINTGSVKLTKYEVFAAQWNDIIFDINDEEITEKVISKYKSLETEWGMVVDFDEDKVKKQINLFEYCYAISEILKDEDKEFTLLFGGKKNKGQTDPIGFDLLCVLSGKRINNAGELTKVFINSSPKFLKDLKNSIIDVCNEVTHILRPWIIDCRNTNISPQSIYQIIHIINSLYTLKYKVNFDSNTIEKINNSKRINNFKKYMPINFLYDVICDFWGQNRQVSDLDNELKDPKRLYRYEYKIPTENWDIILCDWIDNENNSKRKYISPQAKLFLHYIHKLSINKDAEYAYRFRESVFDIEHICPKARLAIIEDIPISSVGNLCYLSMRSNRSKSNKTLYEDRGGRPEWILENKILKLLLYPLKEEISFLDCNPETKCEKYKIFLNERKNILIKRFKELVDD